MSRIAQSGSRGFTLPELLVTMIVLSIMSAAIIGISISMLNNYAITKQRTTNTSDVRTGLARISGDIHQSYAALPENVEDDPQAPTPPSWHASDGNLILVKTPRDSSDEAIYDDAEMYSGQSDSIVYYLNTTTHTLYRRLIPANYATNSLGNLPKTCPTQPGGGCPSDEKIMSDVSLFTVTYYDDQNNVTTSPADAWSVSVEVKVSRLAAGKMTEIRDTIQVALQRFDDLDPVTDPGPITNPQIFPGMTAGPGGLKMVFSRISGNSMYLHGKMSISRFAHIGLGKYRLDIANRSCGTGATYGTLCSSPPQPITQDRTARASATPICAQGQTTTSTRLIGLTVPCSPTPLSPNLPTFDKTNFTNNNLSSFSMPSTCTIANSRPAISIPANKRITTDLIAQRLCRITIKGDLYITGNLQIDGASWISVDDSVTQRPIIVVNGQVTLKRFSKIRANKKGISPIIISFYSSNTTHNNNCSKIPSCTTITPADLYSNLSDTKPAILITSASSASASLYAFFDSAQIIHGRTTGALAAQGIDVQGLSTVKLTTGLWPR